LRHGPEEEATVQALEVEPELDGIAVLDDVFLAFDAEFAGFAGFGLGVGELTDDPL
jgi:hypothetical protein